ncbi:unnamed protein product [Calypogeia fissa]
MAPYLSANSLHSLGSPKTCRNPSIEHVGSTSVPGLAAKPVIDIDIVTTRPNVPFAIAALEKAGYVYEGERGILDRHSFTTPLISEIDGVGKIKRNIYLCPEDALALKNHLAVKDLLTKDQELRDEYGRVKMGLAEMEVESIDEYVKRKTEVLKKILGRAGLGVEELEEIEKANTRMVPRS